MTDESLPREPGWKVVWRRGVFGDWEVVTEAGRKWEVRAIRGKRLMRFPLSALSSGRALKALLLTSHFLPAS